MHSATLLYLTILGGLGASGNLFIYFYNFATGGLVQVTDCVPTGSPMTIDKRQLVPFPADFPFQSLSGDRAGALAAIQSNNLGGETVGLIYI